MSNTVIALRSSGVVGNVPNPTSLQFGEFALNYADGIIYYRTVSDTLGSVRTTEPSGLNQELQFNDSGSFGSSANLKFFKANNTLQSSNVSIGQNLFFPDSTVQVTAWTGADTYARNKANGAYDAANTAVTSGQANVGAGLISVTNTYQANVGSARIGDKALWEANTGAGLITEISARQANVGSAISQAQANTGAGLITEIAARQANVGAGLITVTSAYQANVGAGLLTEISARQANTGAGLIAYQTTSQANVGSAIAQGQANVGAGLITVTNAYQANVGAGLIAIGDKSASAFAQANLAFDAANTKVSKTGDVMSGTLQANNLISNTSITVGLTSVVGVSSNTYTTSSTSQVSVDAFPKTAFRSAKYFVQMTSGTSYHIIELALIHDGTTVYLSQYGEVYNDSSLGTFDSIISVGSVHIMFTPTNSTTTVNLMRSAIVV